jgi:hypothetical protein
MPTPCVECNKYVAVLREHNTKRKLCLGCFRAVGKPPATVIHTPPLKKGWEESFVTLSVIDGFDVKFEQD